MRTDRNPEFKSRPRIEFRVGTDQGGSRWMSTMTEVEASGKTGRTSSSG